LMADRAGINKTLVAFGRLLSVRII